MTGFTDIHAHIVYGVDDGPRTRADMEAMLDAAREDGVETLFATPHMTPGIQPFDGELFERHLAQARQYCLEKGYGMTLLAGAEILYTPAISRSAAERMLFPLADTGHILLEFVPDIAYPELEAAVELAEDAGYAVILAHIERYVCLCRRQNARRLKERHDVRYQVNCSAILDGRGFWRDRRIHGWLRDELVDFVASDAHDCSRRPSRMHDAYRALERRVGRAYAQRLMGIGESGLARMAGAVSKQ